jgi:hypothetical protein
MRFPKGRRARVLVGALMVLGVGAVATIVQSAGLSFAAPTSEFAGLSKAAAGDTLVAAWTELGPDGAQVVRAIINGSGDCSSLQLVWTGQARPTSMTVHADPTGAFTDRVCQAPLPVGVTDPMVTGPNVKALAVGVRPTTITSVALLGDTGCANTASTNTNKKKKSKMQTCSAPDWPFGQIAQSIRLERPDLIIHLGDIFYRTSTCPAGCSNGIDQDFFQQAEPMLAVAPLVMVRGNHEEYGKHGDCVGWFRYFAFTDPGPTSCTTAPPTSGQDCPQGQQFTQPYKIMLNPQLALVVLDTSAAPDDPMKGTPEWKLYIGCYTDELRYANTLATQQPAAWLISHVPLWYVADKGVRSEGGPEIIEQALLAAGGPSANLRMIISGHLHQFEYLSFKQEYNGSPKAVPAQLILGNGGTLMSNAIEGGVMPGPVPGDTYDGVQVVRGIVVGKDKSTLKDPFGFGVIELNKDVSNPDPQSIWILMLHVNGHRCTLTGHDLSCTT